MLAVVQLVSMLAVVQLVSVLAVLQLVSVLAVVAVGELAGVLVVGGGTIVAELDSKLVLLSVSLSDLFLVGESARMLSAKPFETFSWKGASSPEFMVEKSKSKGFTKKFLGSPMAVHSTGMLTQGPLTVFLVQLYLRGDRISMK